MATTSVYQDPDWMFVKNRFAELQWENQGAHTKIAEIEALRYYEDKIPLQPGEKRTNQTVRIGLTDEQIENIKASILANDPKAHFKPLRKKSGADANASKREGYWQEYLTTLLYPVHLLAELCDAQLMGYGILKSGLDMTKWDSAVRKRKRGESSEDHIDRVNGYKRQWGHPTESLTVSPLAIYCSPGVGSKIEEVIEYGFKAKSTVYKQYNLTDASLAYSTPAVMPTMPNNMNRPLAVGVDTSKYVEVYEYWNPEVYKVFVNGTEVHKQYEPSVKYWYVPGRASSSKDPDKTSMSVVENLRNNEPAINRILTRMLEATELLVEKRNTLEVPEGYVPELDEVMDETGKTTGQTIPRRWTFGAEYADALPAGAKLVDAYAGVDKVFEAMPMLQLLLQVVAQHGVSPLLKGISPGAAGSGYRDNSLYLMAKSMFKYIVDSLQACLSDFIRWHEWLIVNKIKQEVWCGPYSLSPADIADWPVDISVELKPNLPQNLIAEGEFWERQREAGNVSRRFVREVGLGIEQPDEMQDEVDFEQAYESLKPYLNMDVLAAVFGRGPLAQQATGGLVDPQGNPLQSQQSPSGETKNVSTTSGRTGGSTSGREVAGYATAGQSRQPSQAPGSTL